MISLLFNVAARVRVCYMDLNLEIDKKDNQFSANFEYKTNQT